MNQRLINGIGGFLPLDGIFNNIVKDLKGDDITYSRPKAEHTCDRFMSRPPETFFDQNRISGRVERYSTYRRAMSWI